jgi:hypothetical protein
MTKALVSVEDPQKSAGRAFAESGTAALSQELAVALVQGLVGEARAFDDVYLDVTTETGADGAVRSKFSYRCLKRGR